MVWKNCCRRDAMVFQISAQYTKVLFLSWIRMGRQAALWELSSGLSQQSPAVFAWSGSPCAGGSWLPMVLAEATGSWKQRELGAPASLHVLSVLWACGDQHRFELCWLQGTRHDLSLCRCFSDKWVQPHGFPADFSRVKSESLREEKQQQQSHLLSAFT